MSESRPPAGASALNDESSLIRYRLYLPAVIRKTIRAGALWYDIRMASKNRSLAPVSIIERKIYLIRRQKVMLSTDLAALYDVEPRTLVQAVKRNLDRFPADFMFQLNAIEYRALKSQIVISSWGGARRATPYAFTEQGVAMLSSVLRSERAIQVNIAIMRAFVRLRELLATHRDLAQKLEMLERKYDHRFRLVFDAIRNLIVAKEPQSRRQMGFGTKNSA